MKERPTTRSDPWADLVRVLRQRPRSVSEARDLLRRRGHEAEAVEQALCAALDAGLLDDRSVARLWVNDRLWHHPLSRAAVVQELRGKGLDRETIDAALEVEGYTAARETELVRELAEARYRRLRGVDPDRRRARTLSYLTRRGFSTAQAHEALRRVAAEAEGEDG